jgi:hypothetical protein
MSIKIVGEFSKVPLSVMAYFNDYIVGTATAFIYAHEGRMFLVTNWHVVTGLHAQDRKFLHSQCAVPNRLAVRFHDKQLLGAWILASLHLYASGVPVWFEHPKFCSAVDVVAIPVALADHPVRCFPVNEVPHDSFDVLPGQDAFVLGFPEKFHGGGFPIWKRASIATEPDVDVDDMPKFFVDTATRRGMSGAPVIAQVSGLWRTHGFDGEVPFTLGRAGQKFIGIYSSREGESVQNVQLGVVWKARAITDVIEGRIVGTHPHPDNDRLAVPADPCKEPRLQLG